MGPGSGLPRLPRIALRVLLPARRWNEVLGDLEEMYRAKVRSRGEAAARRWLRTETMRLVLSFPSLYRRVRFPRPELIRDLLDAEHRPFHTEMLMRHLKHAFRALIRAPGFTTIAVLTLALGIGANTAVFSVAEAVLFRPLPYDDPEELQFIWSEMRNRDVQRFFTSFPMFQDYERELTAYESLGYMTPLTFAVTGDGMDPEQVDAAGVSPNFFSTLGVAPAIGRTFTSEDFLTSDGGAAFGGVSPPWAGYLSHDYWMRRYGGAPNAVGQTIELDGRTVEIAGVLPEDFSFELPPDVGTGGRPEIWTAMPVDYAASNPLNAFSFVVGRVAPGVTEAQISGQMERLATSLHQQYEPMASAGLGLYSRPMQADIVSSIRPMLLALLGAVAFVLLIACANVANLVLVRASTREREGAIRVAMGGGRTHVILPYLAESGILALTATLLGIGLAYLGVEALGGVTPEGMPRLAEVSVNGTVLTFSIFAGVLSAVLFGLAPVTKGLRPEAASLLKDRSAVKVGSRSLRDGVAVVEVALSVVLLVGAVLMIRTFSELQSQDPGFDAESVLTFTVNPPVTRYADAEAQAVFRRQLKESLSRIPRVQAAGAASPLPMRDGFGWGRYGDEEALADPSAFKQANYRIVEPGYLDAMSTALVEGRLLTEADNADGLDVVLVDEVMADQMWSGESAIGKRLLIRLIGPEPTWVNVVGVVEPQKQMSLAEIPRETIYITAGFAGWLGGLRWTLRTTGEPTAIAGEVRQAVAELDGQVPVTELLPMTTHVERSMASTRFALTLLTLFGAIALTLALVGLYGVLSSLVAQRRTEIGIRMAFGAEGGSILKLVARRGLGLAALGVFAGLVAAFWLGQGLSTLLVGVSPRDPLTFAAVAALFLAVSAVATLVPALRAVRVNPVESLRAE